MSNGLRIERQRKPLVYEAGFDEDVAALEAEKTEKLARCLVKVVLNEPLMYRCLTLTNDFLVNEKFASLFKYVKCLHLNGPGNRDFGQNDLDRLPYLFAHLVKLVQFKKHGCLLFRYHNPIVNLNDFVDGPLKFRFLTRFKGLQVFETENWRLSKNELRQVFKECKFLREVQFCSARLLEQSDVKYRCCLSQIGIVKVQAELFEVDIWCAEREFQTSGRETFREAKEYVPILFDSLEWMLYSLDQWGYLRKEEAEQAYYAYYAWPSLNSIGTDWKQP